MNKNIIGLIAGLVAWLATAAYAQTNIQHTALAYYVPGKRIQVQAQVSDPKGIKLARTYFKVGPQADYLLVPMQSMGSGRYASVLPAPSPAADTIEYLVLAVNDAGEVARTDAYKMAVRRTGDAPAWQNVRADGPMKVFTEVPQAQMPTASFTDSVTMDLVESGARFGTVAGLAGGGSGAGSGGAAGSSAGTSAASAAAVGGLSTAAIVGGVALAGVAAAAAGGGGGGGGGSGGGGSTPTGPAAYAGNYSGSWSASGIVTGGGASCGVPVTCSGSWSGSVSTTGSFTGTFSLAGSSCGGVSAPPSNLTGTVNASGVMNLAPASDGCPAVNIQFTSSPRSAGLNLTCNYTIGACSYRDTLTITGNGT